MDNPEKSIYQKFPKVDLHRHLEGSIRFQTLVEIAREYNISIPVESIFRNLVQVQEHDLRTPANFLAKFQILRTFYCSLDVIDRITREAIEDAAKDHIRYMELRFTPHALSCAGELSISEVIEHVISKTREVALQNDIKIGLIISVNRHEPIEYAREAISLAIQNKYNGISGVDLAGNEVNFPAIPFAGILQEAHQEGLGILIHAGEWGGPEHIREAIELFKADRIGHGVRVIEDPEVVSLAVDRGIPFEVCLTSNYHTGVAPKIHLHPITAMISAGLSVTINSDDPGISQITLSDEYCLANRELGIPLETLFCCNLTAARSAFLPEDQKMQLITRIVDEMKKFGVFKYQ
jgi:adenosine deaminase